MPFCLQLILLFSIYALNLISPPSAKAFFKRTLSSALMVFSISLIDTRRSGCFQLGSREKLAVFDKFSFIALNPFFGQFLKNHTGIGKVDKSTSNAANSLAHQGYWKSFHHTSVPSLMSRLNGSYKKNDVKKVMGDNFTRLFVVEE